MTPAPSILFERLAASNGKQVGAASLNKEQSLNALSLDMVNQLREKLIEWENDNAIACVFLQGVGDKAFCAGGDVVALFNAAAAYGESLTNDFALQFFSREYRLDYHIHTYSKPVIVWGNGIVMGGGLGLLSGASHRVVTESTRMAMPEVSIGLYPDVGGTWFLNHTPGHSGLFLGLTGVPFNAVDAKFVGLGDRFIPHAEKASVLNTLTDLSWSENSEDNHSLISQVLRQFEQASVEQQPPAQVEKHLSWINHICDADRVVDIVERITGCDSDDPWISKAVQGLRHGCPVTPYLVFEQLRRGKYLSLAEVFRMELIMSVNCAAQGHFREGVRALLIDKDRNPVWEPDTVAAVEPKHIDVFFDPPWGASAHPLKDLGT